VNPLAIMALRAIAGRRFGRNERQTHAQDRNTCGANHPLSGIRAQYLPNQVRRRMRAIHTIGPCWTRCGAQPMVPSHVVAFGDVGARDGHDRGRVCLRCEPLAHSPTLDAQGRKDHVRCVHTHPAWISELVGVLSVLAMVDFFLAHSYWLCGNLSCIGLSRSAR
jgi:hypothetical protein